MITPGKRLPELLSVLLALFAGVVVFINYLFHPSLLAAVTQFFLKVTVLTAGAALLMAAFNLLQRHVRRIPQKNVGSLLLTVAFIITFVAGLLPGEFRMGLGAWVYHWLLAPGLAALFALLPIFLAYALYRYLSVRTLGGFLLFLGLIVVLLGQIPSLIPFVPQMTEIRYAFITIPAAIAFRGVILGLSAGVILAVLTKLFGSIGITSPGSDDGGQG